MEPFERLTSPENLYWAIHVVGEDEEVVDPPLVEESPVQVHEVVTDRHTETPNVVGAE